MSIAGAPPWQDLEKTAKLVVSKRVSSSVSSTGFAKAYKQRMVVKDLGYSATPIAHGWRPAPWTRRPLPPLTIAPPGGPRAGSQPGAAAPRLGRGAEKAEILCQAAYRKGQFYDDPSFPGDKEERWYYIHAGSEIASQQKVEQAAEVQGTVGLDEQQLQACAHAAAATLRMRAAGTLLRRTRCTRHACPLAPAAAHAGRDRPRRHAWGHHLRGPWPE
jgi:hypothetical protein